MNTKHEEDQDKNPSSAFTKRFDMNVQTFDGLHSYSFQTVEGLRVRVSGFVTGRTVTDRARINIPWLQLNRIVKIFPLVHCASTWRCQLLWFMAHLSLNLWSYQWLRSDKQLIVSNLLCRSSSAFGKCIIVGVGVNSLFIEPLFFLRRWLTSRVTLLNNRTTEVLYVSLVKIKSIVIASR